MIVAPFPRYGDSMVPLDIDALPLRPIDRADPAVIYFIDLCDRVGRAERVSDPSSWTDIERNVYDGDDWSAFSRLRGYSESEIRQFSAFMFMALALNEEYDDPDYSASLSFLVQRQTEKS